MRMIGIPKNFIGTRPGRVYSWGDSASIQTASGTAVTFPQSEERAFSGLCIYGHSTQSGTPSPENPVPIVSAGDSGEIEAKVYGGNLISSDISSWNKSGWGTFNDTVLQLSDGIKIKAINGWTKLYYDTSEMNGKTLNLSFDYRQIESETTSPSVSDAFSIVVQNENAYPTENGGIFPFKINSPETVKTHVSVSFIARNYLCFFLRVHTEGQEAGETRVIEVTNIMLNAGNTELTYEPYKTPQSIVLSTPNGLPGIPVTSDGNYTDADGQQWICDEIDLKRGKYVQRVGKGTLNSDNVPNQKVTTYDECDVLLYQISDMENFEGYRNLLCNKYGAFNGYWTDGLGKMSSNLGHVYFGVPKGESSISDGTEFVYPLETPIETDITAEEIDDYQALRTYSPNTTVSNDAEAWIKVEYNG